MANRIKLNDILLSIVENVYFNPPESFKLKYPCIVYNRSDADLKYADDTIYNATIQYTVTIIDKNPDTPLVEKMLTTFNQLTYVNHYNADGLSHDVFELYY